MMINQNILAILRTFSNHLTFGNPKDICKKFYEKLCTKETSSKAAATKFLSKLPNRKKISKERFNFCEGKISSNEIMKSINSQRNNKFLGNDALTAEF